MQAPRYPLDEARILADKLQLLIDARELATGETVSYQLVADYLAEHGIRMPRTRWSFMLNGRNSLVINRRIVAGVAEFFGADPAFLLDPSNNELPNSVRAQADLIRVAREREVKDFALRQLGWLSPDTLDAITEAIAGVKDTSERTDNDTD